MRKRIEARFIGFCSASGLGAGLLILLFLSVIQDLRCQNETDFQTWTSAELRYRPSKKWRIGLESQLRLKENSSEIDGYFFELTGGHELFKNFRLVAGYRFIRKNDNTGKIQGYENHQRFHFDANYSHKIERLELRYRLRYQTRDELGVSSSEGDYANQYLRFLIGTEYDIKKWKLDPDLSAEIFHHNQKGEETGFNKARLTIGTTYNMKKAGKLGLFYRYEFGIGGTDRDNIHILRLKYVYTIKGY